MQEQLSANINEKLLVLIRCNASVSKVLIEFNKTDIQKGYP